MHPREKIAVISASAVVIAALVTAFFSYLEPPKILQQTECGAAIANTQGSVVITGKTLCEKTP